MKFSNIFFTVISCQGKKGLHPAEYRMVTNMLLATRRAPSIMKISQAFSREILKGSYAAMHWRYDMKDFGNHCKRGGNKRVCKWINNGGFNATDLGIKMLNWLNEKNAIRKRHQQVERRKKRTADKLDYTKFYSDNSSTNISDSSASKSSTADRSTSHSSTNEYKRLQTIYFASPPIEIPLIQNISKIIEAGGYQVFYQTHLRDFVTKRFKKCDRERFELQLHDFVSQTEQQLCTDAGIFLGSESSTWSGAIGKDRAARNLTKYDGSNIVFL